MSKKDSILTLCYRKTDFEEKKVENEWNQKIWCLPSNDEDEILLQLKTWVVN